MHDLLHKLNYGNIHIFNDNRLNFTAIIAIHTIKNNSAIGGCRCLPYNDFEKAANDALYLAHAMTDKSNLHGLPYGGAKSVIILPKQTSQRREIFHKFGEFVESLNGKYVAAVDSGTTPADMEQIAKTTSHVLAKSILGNECNPSKYTADGVFNAILGANSHLYGTDNIKNKVFILQGVGAVGMLLAEKIHRNGGHLYITDINQDALHLAKTKFNAKIVENILDIKSDYFVPCALGGSLNKELCETIQTKAIIGAANNQLPYFYANTNYEILKNRGIHWVPDYLCNGGGLIHVVQLYKNLSEEFAKQKISNIKEKTIDFLRVSSKNKASNPKEVLDAIN